MSERKEVWYCQKHEALGDESYGCFEELIMAGPYAYRSGTCVMVKMMLVPVGHQELEAK